MTRKVSLILNILIVCVACFYQIHGQKKNNPLAGVKRIYVEQFDFGARILDFSNTMKVELKRTGLVVADDEFDADAVLSMKDLSIEVLPPATAKSFSRFTYEFALSTRLGEIIWVKTIKFLSRIRNDNNDKIASQKLAAALSYELRNTRKKVIPRRKKSAK